jgi:hypothetical protein
MGQLIKAYLDESDDFKAVKTTAILNRLKVIGDFSGKQLDQFNIGISKDL